MHFIIESGLHLSSLTTPISEIWAHADSLGFTTVAMTTCCKVSRSNEPEIYEYNERICTVTWKKKDRNEVKIIESRCR